MSDFVFPCPRRVLFFLLLFLFVFTFFPAPARAQSGAGNAGTPQGQTTGAAANAGVQPAAGASFTAGMPDMAGFFPLYWGAKKGKAWMGDDHIENGILYLSYLTTLVGSDDMRLCWAGVV